MDPIQVNDSRPELPGIARSQLEERNYLRGPTFLLPVTPSQANVQFCDSQ